MMIKKIFPYMCLLGLTALAHAQPVGLPNITGRDESDLPVGIERKIGDIIMSRSLSDPTYIDDPDLRYYFNQMADRLAINSPVAVPEINVFAVKDTQINAFAMPGGYIGINTGLVANAKAESEVAGVLGHEIAHVAQRHIARGVGQAKNDTLIMLASIAAAALASQVSGQGAQAALVFGQAAAVDAKLGYSRAAEQEADRVGIKMLEGAGYDPKGMVDFFGKLTQVSSLNTPVSGSFASTHPLSSARMADMQTRIQSLPPQVSVSSPDFYFVQALMMVYQAQGSKEQFELLRLFQEQVTTYASDSVRVAAAYFGMAMIHLNRNEFNEAQKLYLQAMSTKLDHPMLARLGIELELAMQRNDVALFVAEDASSHYPERQSLAILKMKALLANHQEAGAITHAKEHLKSWSRDQEMYKLLAQAYAQSGQSVAEKKAMAEYYSLRGALPSAIIQLQQARQLSQDFYEQSVIDARLTQLMNQSREEKELIKQFS